MAKIHLRYIRTKPGDYYVLRVRGNSMIDALIPDGSMVLIRRSDAPVDGAIQVVSIEGHATLKRLWCFVQCAKCGTILGVTDDHCIADMLEKQNATIRAIAAKAGARVSL